MRGDGARRWTLALALAACVLARAEPAGPEALWQTLELLGVNDPKVLEAMKAVPRDQFVPERERAHAWEDRSLAIDEGQRITQPSLVGRMTQLLELQPGDKVLEVGTGSGYHAAVLSRLGAQVFSVELIPALADSARARLQRLGFGSVQVKAGDGFLGWPEEAPFAAILVTCAPDAVPPPLVAQLREGGRLVIPVGPVGGPQTLHAFRKQGGVLVPGPVEPVQFVPLLREPGKKSSRVQAFVRRVGEQQFAFFFSLLVEIPIALLLCARDRRSALATLGAALVATGVSHPVAWWAFMSLEGKLSWAAETALVELAVAAFESLVYRSVARVSWSRAALTSALANLASFALGQWVWLL